MVKWVGFKQTAIKVEHAPRAQGETSYNFKKLLNLAIDIILAYSDKPIRLTIKAGFLVSFFALLIGLIYLVKYFSGDIIVPGYASLIISIWFLSGLIITILGVVGLYVGKTFEGVKNRPIYIISEKTI
jgi:dolichol-phosphate mannosyltransferase